MNWDRDATEALERAPAFLRGMVKKRVEAFARSHGSDQVTVTDVEQARQHAGRDNSELKDEYGGLQPEQIEKIVAQTKNAVISDSRFYEVIVCGGSFGCPRALSDVGGLARRMVERIETSGLPGIVASRVKGPVLRHHKFTAAIAGCPNSCSQPQIRDFGVQGRVRADVTDNPCIDCGACLEACKEAGIAVDVGEVRIDRSLCIDCGDCASVCPTGTLVRETVGYSVLVGGKLGRHPQLAREIVEFGSEDEVLAALDAALDIFSSQMLPGERMADAVTRIGAGEIRSRIVKDSQR